MSAPLAKLKLNTLELDLFLIISDNQNIISNNERQILLYIYNNFRDIILSGLKNKCQIEEINNLFWLNNIIHMMIYLEDNVSNGLLRKQIIIEIVSLIIKKDTTFSIQEKVSLTNKIQTELSNVIDLYVFASKNLNKNSQTKSRIKKLIKFG